MYEIINWFSLRRVLHLRNDDNITSNLEVNVDWLKHNVTCYDASGLVLVPSNEEIPCWVVSAMKCLSNWPDSIDTGLPNYEGIIARIF